MTSKLQNIINTTTMTEENTANINETEG